jgi:hypothetical protein
MPVDSTNTPLRRWKVVLVDNSAKNQPLDLSTRRAQRKGNKLPVNVVAITKLSDLDCLELKSRNENQPAARFKYSHFVMTPLLTAELMLHAVDRRARFMNRDRHT